jgi:2'-5' RNA ligase
MYRIFVAIELPEPQKQMLKQICNGLPGARWLDENQMHVTLRFIGEVDGADFRDARDALAGIHVGPFEMAIKGVGYFPPRGNPQMLWAGIDGNDRIEHLRNKIESTLVRTGFKPEGRKFKPHVGLAKVKDTSPAKLASFLREYALFRLPAFEVTEFCLFSSYLASERAMHEIEAVYPLKTDRSEAE